MNKKKLLFPLIAFIIPVLIRVIPEVLMGPYVVGFDTMGYYVPTTLLWLNGSVNLWSFIAIAPLLYTLTASFTWISGQLILVLKILSPILLGLLGLSLYVYAKRGLGFTSKRSLLSALLGTLYFVALRVSWDALREECALIFLFIALTLLTLNLKSDKDSLKRYLFYSFAVTAVVLSNQVVAVLMLGILLFTAIHSSLRKKFSTVAKLVIFTLPAVLLFFTMLFLTNNIPEYRLIFGFPSTNDGWLALFGYSSYQDMLTSELGFILYCFLPLFPISLLAWKKFNNFQMRSWVVLILFVVFIPMVSPSALRLVMLLTYPLAFYATEGLNKLKSFNSKRIKGKLYRLGLIYLASSTILLGAGFILMSPANPFIYFRPGVNGYIYDIPTSMLQNTISIEDCRDTEIALNWLHNNMNGSSILLTHRVFYGWGLSIFDRNQVKLYEYGNPVDAAISSTAQGYNAVYLIWWVNGKGWNGQPTLPSSFNESYVSGKIAIYLYTAK